jgi:ATP-dependent Clp protease, protease subunit
MNKLLAFYRGNQGKGSGFQAMGGDEPRLMIYDMIVSSDSDAEWLGGVSAESFVRAMQSQSAPRVHVHINSPGGDASAGIAMAAAIRAYPGEVVVHVDGIAASAAGFLCAAAPRVVMAMGAMIMVHKAWTIAFGNADDMMAVAAILEKFDAQQVEMFRTKNAEYDWPAALSAETWLTADEAIAIGLATEREPEKPVMALGFDLSAFDNAPALPEPPAPQAAAPDDTAEQDAIARRRRVARALELQQIP